MKSLLKTVLILIIPFALTSCEKTTPETEAATLIGKWDFLTEHFQYLRNDTLQEEAFVNYEDSANESSVINFQADRIITSYNYPDDQGNPITYIDTLFYRDLGKKIIVSEDPLTPQNDDIDTANYILTLTELTLISEYNYNDSGIVNRYIYISKFKKLP